MTPTPRNRTRILSAIRKNVLKHHFNAARVSYEDWTKRFDSEVPELITAETEVFERGVRQLLSELRTSHTLFYYKRPHKILPQYSINATLRAFPAVDKDHWFFLDVFENGPAHSAGITPGDRLYAVDGIEYCPPELPPFRVGGEHVVAVANARGVHRRDVVITVPNSRGTKSRPPLIEPTPVRHAVVEPAIGVLRVLYFPGALGMQSTRLIDAAMTSLRTLGCDGLIIDLRGNIGGGLGFARLVSYLCPGQVPIGHSLTPRLVRMSYDRNRLPRVTMPRNTAELIFTFVRYGFRDRSIMLLTQGLGHQPFHGRIVMLINEWTNSAGEMVASFASETGLATLVGTKTPGNVLGAANLAVGGGYWLRLPMAGWYTASGKPVEGNGVVPDVAVEVDPYLLSEGVDQQMDKAVELLKPSGIDSGVHA